ncbi:MAG: hypothetical protein KF686_13480 [Ramlibacter sp.]|nr:hypothetical protein [Ramlibacter sp.]
MNRPSVWFPSLILSTSLAAGAVPVEPPSTPAGPQPAAAAAQQAVVNELRRTAVESDFSRVRFVSGPRLVTGVNFAGNREQAWQVCVLVGSASLSRGPLDLDLKPYLLRNQDQRVTVVQIANWKDSNVSC